jgi:rubredoxin
MAGTGKTPKTTVQTKKKSVATKAKATPSAKKVTEAPKKKASAGTAKTVPKTGIRLKGGKAAKKSASKKLKSKKGTSNIPRRYKCRLCGYIYSPLRGEPQHGIPAGTEFDDLPDDYVCPLCGFQGRGKIGTWGFDEWHPTKYICSVCGYVYDEQRGEPHRGIKPGTKFEDLPDNYVCPVCALDPKIDVQFGKVLKQGFGPLYIP